MSLWKKVGNCLQQIVKTNKALSRCWQLPNKVIFVTVTSVTNHGNKIEIVVVDNLRIIQRPTQRRSRGWSPNSPAIRFPQIFRPTFWLILFRYVLFRLILFCYVLFRLIFSFFTVDSVFFLLNIFFLFLIGSLRNTGESIHTLQWHNCISRWADQPIN